jgi:hypothetical protein
MGPVPPPSTAGTGCCVWFDSAVGVGVSAVTGVRCSTSKRSIGCEKGWAPNSGLAGAPVGMLSARALPALPTNGLRPWIGAMTPAAVTRPSFTRSRRESCPCDRAFTISARSFCAFCASRSRLPRASMFQNDMVGVPPGSLPLRHETRHTAKTAVL